MNKKPISFGKISLNVNNDEKKDEIPTSGFGTFGRIPIQEQKEIEEIADDLENQHVEQVMGIKNFGKKAKNFNVEEMMEEARKTAQEVSKQKTETKDNATDINKSEGEEDVPIGPPVPSELKKYDAPIGPPIPKEVLHQYAKTHTVDSDDDDSSSSVDDGDDDELTLEKEIPNTHEVRFG